MEPQMSTCRAAAMSSMLTPAGTVMAISVLTLSTTCTVVVEPVISTPPTAALSRLARRSGALVAETAERSSERTDVVA